jgi:hypothetical protein
LEGREPKTLKRASKTTHEEGKMIARLSILTVALWCNLHIIGVGNAQEEKNYMYAAPKETKAEEVIGGPIYSGTVIAYGKRIAPPYYITMRNDTVWINDVPYKPSWREPNLRPQPTEVTELVKQKHSLVTSISIDYRAWADQFGQDSARQMILEKYKEHPLISSMQFSGQSLKLMFKDIDVPMVLSLERLGPPMSKEQIAAETLARRRDSMGSLTACLTRGEMIIFSYTTPTYEFTPRTAAEVITIVLSVKSGAISHEQGQEELGKIIRPKHALEILSHLDSWD